MLFLILFIVEVGIAFYFKKGFIRHVFGDYLVILLLYYFFKSFTRTKTTHIAIAVLLISYFIEFLQLIDVLNLLHIQKNMTTNLILGTTFSAHDLITYTFGFFTILLIEKANKYATS